MSETPIESSPRKQVPVRFKKANANAKLASLQATIEDMMGLPSGCITFTTPDGRKVRSDATVHRLRAHWGE